MGAMDAFAAAGYKKPKVLNDLDHMISIMEAEESLLEFTRQAWHIIEPNSQFRDNWHLRVVAEHLQDLFYDPKANDLLINIPPGCMKSILVGVMWPAWVWLHDPSKRFMGASYSEELSIRDAMKTRDIITSEWYRERWSNVELKKGEDQKIKYGLTGGGWRLSTSTGGRATGEHPDFKLCDDPHSAAQAQSDAERQRALDWFDNTLSTRGVSRGARTVVVMQRLHEKDISGHILDDIGGYDHICLPMRYENDKMSHSQDPRTKKGQLLWPELFDEDTVLVLSKRLGEYGTAGQLQQQPAPPGGGILKVEHIKKWPADRPLPQFQFILQSYDTAFTEKTQNDPTACSVWGVFDWETRQCAMLLDSWEDRLAYPQLRQKVISEWTSTYGGDEDDHRNQPRRADLMLIEDKGSGISLIQDLRQAGVGVRTYNPGKMDKLSRAHQFAPILEMGVIYIPESKKNKGEFVSWAAPLLDQMEKFPNAAHDDLCVAEGSLITMADGTLRRIEEVCVGDSVMTPQGSHRVLWSGCTGVREVLSLRVAGRTLRATANHPIGLSGGVYVTMDSLTMTSKVVCHSNLYYLKLKLKSWFLTGVGIVDTLTVRHPLTASISGGLGGSCTAMCGSSITGASQTSATSTTRMKTPATTTSAILSYFSGGSIAEFATRGKLSSRHPSGSTRIWRGLGGLLRSGIARLKGALGTVITPKKPQPSVKLRGGSVLKGSTQRYAFGAAVASWLSRLGLSSAQTLAKLLSGSTENLVRVEAQPSISGVSKVYNLTVDGAHCYFANGVLTHNCDTTTMAFIYLRDSRLLELPFVKILDEPDELDYPVNKSGRINPYAL